MPITVISEWFLLEVEKTIAQLEAFLALKNLRRLISHFLFQLQQLYFSITSISLWRLILLVLKRIGSIIKTWLKEHKVDEWLKVFLHGAYLSAFEDLYLFIYILHFSRAFLTLINYFTDQDNKNLVEVTKFLYACFKVFISLLMLTFMIGMMAHGVAPFSLMAYQHIKILFYCYSFSKLAISLITLGFSFYKFKLCDDSPEQAWLKENYRNNAKKHFEILLVAVPIMLVLTLVSCGLATGPWLWVMLGIASIFLVIDIAKAIYYYVKKNDIPEPKVVTVAQGNSFIDISVNDYYYRKCRTARLENDNFQANQIYLLKEIIVKILRLQTQLTSCSRFNFFSEKPKIQEKIKELKQLANTLLIDDYESNEKVLNNVFNDLQKDYKDLKESDKTLIPKAQIENFINEFNDNSSEETIFDELLHPRVGYRTKDIVCSQSFRQSFFRKIGDCEDINAACQEFRKLSPKETGDSTQALQLECGRWKNIYVNIG